MVETITIIKAVLFFAVVVLMAFGAYREELENLKEQEREEQREMWHARNAAENEALRKYHASTDHFYWYDRWSEGRTL